MVFKLFTSFFIASIFASDCKVASNFPSALAVGQSFPLVTKSTMSPDKTLSTSISGSVTIKSSCSLQLTNLTLTNAPLAAQIQLYGSTSTQSYPISMTVLSGSFKDQDGPIFTLLDTTNFQVSPSSPGIAFSDFLTVSVYAVPAKWVIAVATITEGSAILINTPSTSTPTSTQVTQTAASMPTSIVTKTTIVPTNIVPGTSKSGSNNFTPHFFGLAFCLVISRTLFLF